MAINTEISWAHHTLNMWWGCSKVSAGCKNCYAEAVDYRFAKRVTDEKGNTVPITHWGENAPRKIMTKGAAGVMKGIVADAEKQEGQTRVFVNSMSDFWEDRPDIWHARAQFAVFAKSNPKIIFMILTKRPENILRLWPAEWLHDSNMLCPDNVWLGFTAENQEIYCERSEVFFAVKKALLCKTTFVSVEPMLGQINIIDSLYIPEWVICGGESGQHSRPANSWWFRDLYHQCVHNKIPFFFKQYGSVLAKQMGLKHYAGADFTEWPKGKDFLTQQLP